MLNQNVNPAELPTFELDNIMKAKAEQTIRLSVAQIEVNVEQLEEDLETIAGLADTIEERFKIVEADPYRFHPSYGCNIEERIQRLNGIKATLTAEPLELEKLHHGCFGPVGRILDARVQVNAELSKLQQYSQTLGDLIGQDPPTLDELVLNRSIVEMEFILENLAYGPQDPDYDEIV